MRRGLPAIAAAFAIAFACVIPPGESPDELAHLRYAEALATGRLPALGTPGTPAAPDAYEAHQPPLGYLLPALVVAASGGVDISPVASGQLDFRRAGSRAFREPFASGRDRAVFRVARFTQALWAALAVWAGLALAGGRLSAVPYLLAPQLLFVCGALNNDAALVAGSACALLALMRCAERGTHALAAALLVTAALFVKGSALFLLVPVCVAAFRAPSRSGDGGGSLSPRTTLLAATAAGLAAWIAFQLYRFGTPLPPVPTASHVATLAELVAEPRWLGGLFVSFWAKFGWLNTPMPWPFYLWFAALSLAGLAGMRRFREPRHSILVAALVANVALVVAYLLSVDHQAQGRYLLPSLPALAAIAHFPGRRGPEAASTPAQPRPAPAGIEAAGIAVALAVALAAIVVVARAFR